MQKVYSNENLALVNSAKSLLELNNIESFIKNEFMGSGGHVGLGTALIELWVYNDSHARQASQLIEEKLIAEPEAESWICKHCGEGNEGSFETCWKCQQQP